MSEQNVSRADVLRALDKRDRVGIVGVFDLLTDGRTDASGAVTAGCGLSTGQALELCHFIESCPPSLVGGRLSMLVRLESKIVDTDTGKTGWDYLLEMAPVGICGAPLGKWLAWALDDMVDACKQRVAAA